MIVPVRSAGYLLLILAEASHRVEVPPLSYWQLKLPPMWLC